MGQHQMPLLADRALSFASGREPREQLADIERDRREALGDIRQVLERYAGAYGISNHEITAAITGYATDMLSDLFYEAKCRLEREVEDAEAP